ncbi:DNA polymerase III subunit gamma/tau [Kiritimatiella glycovorans]|uniref:DNA polymerase III subunit gamma/tau n=1 Tax=Kiritimatiella glycovorans TaxID=1307763 RepID=A0A0G3EED7_9BACT|nr:DNA polymerase III subunit gamma/tau [Kiritimatiella glycovorans]AKJ63787.1 DNA polymerase III subunit gamma/tau [Kiritimatiella glycovorans]
MAYEVLARKWRPQRFEDVVGQEHVTRTLRNAIESERVAHAYLFVGPRGIGKTSSARIFAKALNCTDRRDGEPCNECESCTEITADRSLDVIEIDGASNNGVDDVRELRDNARYAPNRGPFKIYVIDEVHMLSTGAFNALLKTLEEPPPHVKFFFATTEPRKVPNTILSRCQRFDLRRISVADLGTQLRKIAAAEEIEITEEALLAIARGAEGGMRDAESALDQLVSFRGKHINEEDVLAVFGLVSQGALYGLLQAVLDGDRGTILDRIAEFDRSGRDLPRLVGELLDGVRHLLVLNCAGEEQVGEALTDAQVEALKALAGKVDEERLLRMTDILVETDLRMKSSLSPRTLLETGLVRCSRAATVVSMDELIRRLSELEGGDSGSPDPSPDPSPAPEAKKKRAPRMS